MEDLIWLIPALPVAGFVLLMFFGRRMGEPGAGWLATSTVGASFVVSIATFLELGGLDAEARVLHTTVLQPRCLHRGAVVLVQIAHKS